MQRKHYVFISLFIFAVLGVFALALLLSIPFVSDDARIVAIKALKKTLSIVPQRGTLIIVDYSQPSQTKRLGAMNLKTGKMFFYARVAHGKNSGGVYVSRLSNVVDSKQSSAGLFEVTESFNGKRGPSLRLKGLDPQLNSNAEIRGIIIHSARYVSLWSTILNWKERFRLGRSDGCFVLSHEDFDAIKEQLVRPAYLYSYHETIQADE